jgi:hypothetical protein
MNSNEETLKKLRDDFDRLFIKHQEDIKEIKLQHDKERLIKLKLEMERQKIIEHESDHNIGEIVRQFKLKISKENLFMDDITREELK